MVDHDLCPWCAEHIEEEHNVMECTVCHYTMHNKCYAEHCPCPDGWSAKEKADVSKSLLGNLEDASPELPAAVTPPLTTTVSQATDLAQQFLQQMEAIQRGETPQPLRPQAYPFSPARPGADGTTQLVNLGVAPGTTSHAGYTVQFGKPREADSVKLLAFPKAGTSFERWWDHTLDSISGSTSFCTDAYRWALECENPETTYEALADSGGFVRLDAMLLTALMECIPGDTHLLRQEVNRARREQRKEQKRNITGRQVLQMIHKFFAMDKFDKEMTDTARLNKISLQNGDIQQFVYKWDEMLSLMTTRPSDDHLLKIFGLQLDSNLAKTHEFYVEYLFWYKKPPTDPERTYEGLWKLVKEWIRRKQELKQRTTALKDHVSTIPGIIRPVQGKGTGRDRR